jgi:peptide deformylase
VLTYPDARLKTRCETAGADEAAQVLRDLIDTMRAHRGCVGLAAPQIGVLRRVAVVDVSGHRLTTSCAGMIALVNPSIIQRAGAHLAREGCLSLPDITADVARAERILVEARAGERAWSEGFEARAIQHELDHLDGVLILDRVASVHALHARKHH